MREYLIQKQLKRVIKKLIISVLFSGILYSTSKIGMENLFHCIAMGAALYGILTIISAFRESEKESLYITGVVACIIVFFLVRKSHPDVAIRVAGVLLMCGGFLRDAYLIGWVYRKRDKNAEKKTYNFSWEFNRKTKDSETIESVINLYNNRENQVKRNFESIKMMIEGDLKEYEELYDRYNEIIRLATETGVFKNEKTVKLRYRKNKRVEETLRKCCEKLESLLYEQAGMIDAINWKRTHSKTEDIRTEERKDSLVYFADCDTLESLTKRYKNLCKVYHPDMGNGSDEIFKNIQAEYEKVKSTM